MPTYKTPDVYVEEISLFPPSVAEVETAIPVFIGHTDSASKNGLDLKMEPTKIDSLVEFRQFFGAGPPIEPTVKLDENNSVIEVDQGANKFFLYDCLRLFFANGGGKCYIVSVDSYDNTPILGNGISGLLGGLKKVAKEDEPTMIVCPDAALLSGLSLYLFQQQALMQCAKLQDRVAICDLKNTGDLDDDVEEFRNNVGINDLKYGAAYVPWLKTNFSKQINFRNITLQRAASGATLFLENLTKDDEVKEFITNALKASVAAVDNIKLKAITDLLSGDNASLKEQFDSLLDAYDADSPYSDADDFQDELRDIYTLLRDVVHGMAVDVRNAITENDKFKFKLKTDLDKIFANNKLDDALQNLIFHHNASTGFTSGKIFVTTGANGTKLTSTITAMNTIMSSSIGATDTDANVDQAYTNAPDADDKGSLAKSAAIEAFGSINAAVNELLATARSYESTFDTNLPDIFSTYKNILTKINESLNELPPGGAIAGVYSKVDNDRGVWKAPANVSLASVVGLSTKIDAKEQEGLNIDVNAGKSVNAIRPFTGRGILVWGARTLAGNDNEWRYISVRRFFNMVEESLKKSTYWAVFEPNDANTWIKVKSMIENYLIQKWRDGALVGAKPEQAFFVNVGLGKTMTAQDILEGRLIVEIGMAVVRPAEFIILRFSHKMQEV